MADDASVEVSVAGLVFDPNAQAPVVILKDSEENIIPIWVGVAEATSIASVLKDISMARPLTHDLMYRVLEELDVRVERVTITELKESTYYSQLSLVQGEKIWSFDARPSDAIAMALRADAPIFVSRDVIQQAKIVATVVEGEPIENGSAKKTSFCEDGSGYFQSIDKDRWSEILDSLDPEDFKFKM